MIPRIWNSFTAVLVSLFVALISTGCADLKASLALRPQIAIKVPGSEAQIPPDRKATNAGWTFVHVAAVRYDTRAGTNIFEDTPAQWYLAFSSDAKKRMRLSWWSTRLQYRKTRALLPQISDAAKMQFGVYPTTFEVVNVFDPSTFTGRREETNRPAPALSPTDVADLQRGEESHISWPAGKNGDPMWHIRSEYTQLEDARNRVATGRPPGPWRVKVGIIDTGFSGVHAATPRFIDEEQEAGDAWNFLSCAMPRRNSDPNACKILKPSDTEGKHGTATIGVLAGSNVRIPPGKNGAAGYEGPLGAIPDATIVPVRVAPWVVSLNTANFAYALDYASRVKECDVVSISHGGSPSMLWYDTINSAYWRGTAMVAAAGDFFSFGPYKRALIPPPSAPIYPAAARRVLSVTGVTADGTTYAAPTWNGFLKGITRFKLLDSLGRGSYGADGSWRNIFWSDEVGDTVAARRLGTMRIYPIAAPSPNIPWLVAASKAKGKTNVIDFDGGGTSAATPQVAAAAALWLEYNQQHWTNLPPADRWKKAEATYQALLRSADRPTNTLWPNKYLGAGLLKANKALDRSFPDIINAGGEDRFNCFARSPRDFFDGDKSLASILRRIGGGTSSGADLPNRFQNQLKRPPTPATPRWESIYRCAYNTRIVAAWHDGRDPDARERKRIDKKSKKDADAATKS